jgi:hypothetical protein
MGFLGFLQGLFTNLLAAQFNKQQAAILGSLLFAIIIGVDVFSLKKRNPSLASQILYGLAALFLSCLFFVPLHLWLYFQKKRHRLVKPM